MADLASSDFALVAAASAAGIAVAMTALWLLSVRLGDASIVDPFWGTGFVIVAWVAAAVTWPPTVRGALLLALASIWGLRLSAYLLWRNWGTGEDFRYRSMRRRWGARFWWVSLPVVFGLQGVIMWVVSLPLQAAAAVETATLGWLDAVGVALWACGIVFEAVGDWQLARFKQDPNNGGRVMDRGLWSLTRHPNYFGDFCVWWGMYLVAAAGGAWWTIIGPAAMSFFLMKVSGVPMLERTIGERRPGYAEYAARTNAFFPGPPKRR